MQSTLPRHHIAPLRWLAVILFTLSSVYGLSMPEASADPSGESSECKRLLWQLTRLAAHWRHFPHPAIPSSGRPGQDVLLASSKAERQAARTRLERFARMAKGERRARLGQALRSGELSELDIWMPLKQAEAAYFQDHYNEAIELTQQWLEMAEAAGREDALARAAGLGLYLLGMQMPAHRLIAVAADLAKVATVATAAWGVAAIQDEYAELLAWQGQAQQALAVYRKAQTLYAQVGDDVGLGNSLVGAADVLFRQGQNERALAAYRRAKALLQKADEIIGQGNSWKGEAEVLFMQGQCDQALEAYRNARALFLRADESLGQGNCWRGEAEVLFRLGSNEGALAAYRQARKLFDKSGSVLGQGNSWKGEADVLASQQQLPAALAAYRQARALYEQIGDARGQGNSLDEEADILFRQNQTKAALAAY